MTIGIDTNVFIRYIVRDNEEQALQADKILDNCTEDKTALINQIVLVEIIWVLKRLYKYPKNDLLKILELILFNNHIQVLNSEEAKNAMIEYQNGSADFSDYFLSEINKTNKVEFTYTFDKKAGISTNFKQL